MTGARWSLGRLTQLVEEVGGALAAAHAADMVHGDVRSANVLLDGDGHFYLADFGLAEERLASPSTDPIDDTPRGCAGLEQQRDGIVTARSDQHALAVMVGELLTGAPPPECEEPHGRQPADEGAVAAVLRRAVAADPDDRFPSIADFVTAWRSATGASLIDGPSVHHAGAPLNGDPLQAIINPYKGLRAFDEADARDFHGRERAIDDLVELIREHRFVAVVGPSGSGKSSLVRAGLAQRLREQGCVVAVAIPGAAPVDEIADALVQVAVHPEARLREDLLEPRAPRRGRRRLVARRRQRTGSRARPVRGAVDAH